MSESFNIPLAVTYNSRIAQATSGINTSGIVGLGIVGLAIVGSTSGSATSARDARVVNCYTETVPNAYVGTKKLYLVKRPGFATSLTPAAGNIGNDVMVWTGNAAKVMSAFGATNSTIYDSTTSKGAITGRSTGIVETELSGVPTLYITSTDSTAWYHDTTSATKITDTDFPGNASYTLAGKGAAMDGYMFQMTSDGKLWNSDLNSVVNWTAASFVTANSYPDTGIGCIRYRDKIMAFGTDSVQFFYNAGNAPLSPLSRIEPMTLKIGAVGYEAITSIDDTVYWAGSSSQGGLAIYSYRDSLQRISTPEVDRILIIAGAGNITVAACKFYGRSFVVVIASSQTFVYCVEERAWDEWNSSVPLWHRMAGVSSGSAQVTYAISKQSTSGKVFTLNPQNYTFQDNGASYSAIIQTGRIGDGMRRTFWEELNVIGDTEASTSDLTISCYDDDYVTAKTLGTVDLSQPRPRLTRCGAALRRAFTLTHSANTPMRLEALSGRKSMGTG